MTNGISWDISREHDMGCNWKILETRIYIYTYIYNDLYNGIYNGELASDSVTNDSYPQFLGLVSGVPNRTSSPVIHGFVQMNHHN